MATCRSCDATIWWAVSTNTGNLIPVDRDPHPDGNLELHPGRLDGTHPMVTVHRQPPLIHEGDLFMTHFATCPRAADHRKRRPK